MHEAITQDINPDDTTIYNSTIYNSSKYNSNIDNNSTIIMELSEISKQYKRFLLNSFYEYFKIKSKNINIVFSKSQNPFN